MDEKTKFQSANEKVLDMIIETDDPKAAKDWGETCEKISSADAKQQEAWVDYQKMVNEHEEKMIELKNAHNKELYEAILKALGIAASSVTAKWIMEMFFRFEKEGLGPFEWLPKEFFSGLTRKVFFRK